MNLVVEPNTSIKIAVDENEKLLHTTPDGNISKELPGIIRECRTVKLDKIDKNRCHFSAYKCLAGPQTIEKAKQASLVGVNFVEIISENGGDNDLIVSKITFENVDHKLDIGLIHFFSAGRIQNNG